MVSFGHLKLRTEGKNDEGHSVPSFGWGGSMQMGKREGGASVWRDTRGEEGARPTTPARAWRRWAAHQHGTWELGP
jgi:hypothetical protein